MAPRQSTNSLKRSDRGLSYESTRPSKISKQSGFDDVLINPTTEIEKGSREKAILALEPSQTVAIVTSPKPTIVTPHNSFHELMRVSPFDDDCDELAPSNIELKVTQKKSEIPRSQSPLDVPKFEDKSRMVNHTGGDIRQTVRRVSWVEPLYEAKTGHTFKCSSSCPGGRSLDGLKAEVSRHAERKFQIETGWLKALGCLIVAVFVQRTFFPAFVVTDSDAVYVPGGGFSGFWYTIGRLNSIDDPLSKKYYCYSAGCLGVVTMLSNTSMTTAYNLASGAQRRWKNGELSRYDVTESFVDGLLYGTDDPQAMISTRNVKQQLKRSEVLSTLKIITSERTNSGGVKMSIRTPTNHEELREMLLQSAWIPFAISRDLWHDGHMDGAFTMYAHPVCPTQLGYGFDWDVILNALNMNLSYEKVALLWQKGLSHGLN